MPQISRPQSSTGARTARVWAQRPPHGWLGEWELLKLIGEGQFASVYQARPTGSSANRPASYAIKVLRPQWQDDPRGLAIFAREFHIGRRVVNPHLVPILAAQLKVAPYYLAMPLLEGWTLADALGKQVQLELPVGFWIARQVAEALEALYRAEWMHADVKPANIFISPTGHVTLIDLGFACSVHERNTLVDRPVTGTMHYMAPEVLGSSLGGDIRSDVYSLGITLFEMLTGRLPFDADDVAELASQHRQDLPGDMRAILPHVPTRAARLVHQMLAKEPLRRPLPAELIDRLAALEIETFGERFWAA